MVRNLKDLPVGFCMHVQPCATGSSNLYLCVTQIGSVCSNMKFAGGGFAQCIPPSNYSVSMCGMRIDT